jgi:hypothetical protein
VPLVNTDAMRQAYFRDAGAVIFSCSLILGDEFGAAATMISGSEMEAEP